MGKGEGRVRGQRARRKEPKKARAREEQERTERASSPFIVCQAYLAVAR